MMNPWPNFTPKLSSGMASLRWCGTTRTSDGCKGYHDLRVCWVFWHRNRLQKPTKHPVTRVDTADRCNCHTVTIGIHTFLAPFLDASTSRNACDTAPLHVWLTPRYTNLGLETFLAKSMDANYRRPSRKRAMESLAFWTWTLCSCGRKQPTWKHWLNTKTLLNDSCCRRFEYWSSWDESDQRHLYHNQLSVQKV